MILIKHIKYITISVATLIIFNHSAAYAEEFDALLHWSKRAELSTPVNGVVQKVFAQPGKIVARGEVLVQLDPRLFKADLNYASASLKNTDEKMQEAKRELDRQTDMYDRTMLSEHDLQVAKNNYTAAKSEYQQAKASLTRAQINLEYSAIRAPFNAIVISVSAVEGQVVASEITPPVLVTIAEAKRMLARAFVDADKLGAFSINQAVKVNVAGKTYSGKVQNIALEEGSGKAGYYAVNVIFDSGEVILRAGQKVKIIL